jgi:hypothetical protein
MSNRTLEFCGAGGTSCGFANFTGYTRGSGVGVYVLVGVNVAELVGVFVIVGVLVGPDRVGVLVLVDVGPGLMVVVAVGLGASVPDGPAVAVEAGVRVAQIWPGSKHPSEGMIGRPPSPRSPSADWTRAGSKGPIGRNGHGA